MTDSWDNYLSQCRDLDLLRHRLIERIDDIQSEAEAKIQTYQAETRQRIAKSREVFSWIETARRFSDLKLAELGLNVESLRPAPSDNAATADLGLLHEAARTKHAEFVGALDDEIDRRNSILTTERLRAERIKAFARLLPYRLLVILRIIFLPVFIWLVMEVIPPIDPEFTVDTPVKGFLALWVATSTLVSAQALSRSRWPVIRIVAIFDLLFAFVGLFVELATRIAAGQPLCEQIESRYVDCWPTLESKEAAEFASVFGLFFFIYVAISIYEFVRTGRQRRSSASPVSSRESIAWVGAALLISGLASIPMIQTFSREPLPEGLAFCMKIPTLLDSQVLSVPTVNQAASLLPKVRELVTIIPEGVPLGALSQGESDALVRDLMNFEENVEQRTFELFVNSEEQLESPLASSALSSGGWSSLTSFCDRLE